MLMVMNGWHYHISVLTKRGFHGSSLHLKTRKARRPHQKYGVSPVGLNMPLGVGFPLLSLSFVWMSAADLLPTLHAPPTHPLAQSPQVTRRPKSCPKPFFFFLSPRPLVLKKIWTLLSFPNLSRSCVWGNK